jgi:invasion protein IalB
MKKNVKQILIVAALIIGVGVISYSYTKAGIQKSPEQPPAGTEQADAGVSDAATGEIWSKRCNEDEKAYCEIYQRIIVKENNQRLLEFAIGYPEGAKQAQAALILPLGITMTQGVALKIDDGELHKAAVRICGNNGCLVLMDMPDNIVESMKTGKVLAVGFLDGNGKQITLPLSLAGFAEQLATVL